MERSLLNRNPRGGKIAGAAKEFLEQLFLLLY